MEGAPCEEALLANVRDQLLREELTNLSPEPLQHPAHPDSADSKVPGRISLARETAVGEHSAVGLLKFHVVDGQFLRPYRIAVIGSNERPAAGLKRSVLAG